MNTIMTNKKRFDNQKGSALIIAILVMILLMGFVVLAIARTTTEMLITSNDMAEARTYAASEASLENTTRAFVDIFNRKLSPDQEDILKIQNTVVPGFEDFVFRKV